MRASYLFTSESVSEGHPDKVCDRISDEIVDLFYREGPKAGIDPWAIRAACETLATTNKVNPPGDPIGLDFNLLQGYDDANAGVGTKRRSRLTWRAVRPAA